jgi:hypothetical protein
MFHLSDSINAKDFPDVTLVYNNFSEASSQLPIGRLGHPCGGTFQFIRQSILTDSEDYRSAILSAILNNSE